MAKYIVPTTPTGNCAFCGVAIGNMIREVSNEKCGAPVRIIEARTPEILEQTVKLRQKAVEWLACLNEPLVCQYNFLEPGINTRRDILVDVVEDEGFKPELEMDERIEAYLENISKDREWACLAEIHAMACILSLRIEVYHTNQQMYAVFDPPESNGVVRLLFHNYRAEGASHFSVQINEDEYYTLCDHLLDVEPLEEYLGRILPRSLGMGVP